MRLITFQRQFNCTLIDIFIFSNSAKKLILIELTCPCEENMKNFHDEKLTKYLPLKTTIEFNGWTIHLFAVEVEARGFCARSVICCFHALGLHNSLVKSTIKELSRLSAESCFCIWVNRNNTGNHETIQFQLQKFKSLVTLLLCQNLLRKPSQHLLQLEIIRANL